MPHLREGGPGGAAAGNPGPQDIVGGVDVSNPGQAGINIAATP